METAKIGCRCLCRKSEIANAGLQFIDIKLTVLISFIEQFFDSWMTVRVRTVGVSVEKTFFILRI